MKVANTIIKILTALAAIAGIVYIVATYGEQIVAWCKKTLENLPKCPLCTKDEAEDEDEDDSEIEVEITIDTRSEEVAAEEIPTAEEADFAPEVAAAEPVAEEADFAE